MNWRDIFYFARGERRVLILLLLIVASTLLVSRWYDRMEYGTTPQPATAEAISPQQDSLPTTTEIASPKQDQAREAAPAPRIEEVKEKRSARVEPPKVQAKAQDKAKAKPATSSTKHPPYPEKQAARHYTRIEKYPIGTVVDLNSADTTSLKKVPGIGSTFASRIVKFREALGGFYSLSQLGEVYGIDEERYESLCDWFSVDSSACQPLHINNLSEAQLRRHPYVNYQQARAIATLRSRDGKVKDWSALSLLDEFSVEDQERLKHYFSFD